MTGDRKRVSQQFRGNETALLRRRAEATPAATTDGRGERVSKPRPAAGGSRPAAVAAVPRGETELEPVARPAQAVTEAAGVAAGPALDAWHASFSDAVTVAQLRREGAQLRPETVFSDDDRRRVTATADFPWRWVCALEITAEDGSQWVGSGFLVSARLVATAGHNVFLHRRGGWARRVRVCPGRDAGNLPGGDFTTDDLRTVTGWTDRRNPQFDYGAILLPQPVDLGFFAYASLPDDELTGRTVNVFGYPADKPAGQLWGTARGLQQVLPRQVVYDLSTFGGQSGCPVWIKEGETRTAVGIHTYGDVANNLATRITDDVYDDLDAWKAEG